MPSRAPLLNNDLELYDLSCLLNVSPQVAQGFIVLLGGMMMDVTAQKNGKLKESDLNLAFSALTDGNIIDACFGVNNVSSKEGASSAARSHVKEVKSALASAGCEDDRVKRAIVDTYRKVFRAILDFHQQVAKLSLWTFCFKYNKCVRDADVAVHDLFEQLVEVIVASK